MPAPKTKAAPAAEHTTPSAPPADPLTAVTARLLTERARQQAEHLANYREAAGLLAHDNALTRDQEEKLAAALDHFGLTTDELKRDAATLRSYGQLRGEVGTREQQGEESTQRNKEMRESAANLDRMRKELELAEQRHQDLVRRDMAIAHACVALDRMVQVNPRLFGQWPPAPKAENGGDLILSGVHNVAGIQAKPASQAPLPSHIVHPIDGRHVPLTPELVERLEKEEPALLANIRERAGREAQSVPPPGPIHYFDASKLPE
jgi:hypothetical protein